MKSKWKILLYCSIILMLWLVIMILLFYIDSNEGGNGGAAWYAFIELAQLAFFIFTPIMLMVIALALLRDDRKDEPKLDFIDTRPLENRPAPRYQRPAPVYEEPEPRPRPRPRAQPRPQPRPQPRVQPRPQPRAQPRAQPRPQPRAQPRQQPRPRSQPPSAFDDVPDYEPSIFDDEIQCPACKKWISTDMPRCAFCRTSVSNFNRVRQVQAQYNQGNITRDQYNHTMKNLKG